MCGLDHDTILFSFFSFMKRYFILSYLVFSMVVSLPCVGQDARNTAKKLNAGIDRQLGNLSSVQSDTVAYYKAIVQLMKDAVICDHFDAAADKKGRSNPRYRNSNHKRLSAYLPVLVDAGMYQYGLRKNDEAMQIFKLYLDCVDSPLFHDKDNNRGFVAYYVSLLSYGKENFAEAERYADVALKDANYAKDAAEIKINCMKTHLYTDVDSAKYITALTALHDMAPTNDVYFKMLIDYYAGLKDRQQQLSEFAADEILKHRDNKRAWALKGEIEIQERKWDDAIMSFKRAVTLDSTYVQAVYDVGICYVSKAEELRDSLESERRRLAKKDVNRIKELYQTARTWLLQASVLDEKQQIVEWKKILNEVDKVLGLQTK